MTPNRSSARACSSTPTAESALSAQGSSLEIAHLCRSDLLTDSFERFVAAELRRQLTWSRHEARLFHYRDHDGAEVDLVLETDDGRVAGIEVKATSSAGSRDARWLSQLRDRLSPRFVAGVILHTDVTAAPFGPRITAAPIDVLWTP